MVRRLSVLALLCVLAVNAVTFEQAQHQLRSGDVVVEPGDPNVQYIGRFDVANASERRFDMPGCEIRVGVKGASKVSVLLSAFHPAGGGFASNGFVVTVDGHGATGAGYNATFTTDNTPNNTVVAFDVTPEGGLDPSHSHTVTVFKTTEAQWNARDVQPNYVTFHGVALDAGSSTELPPLPQRKLEFLGDSITAGYCNVCRYPSKASNVPHGEAFAASWANQVCQQLGAQCHTAAWSGFGMAMNCCGGETTMPTIFNRTLATVEGSMWDWDRFHPDALIINLGTNDGLNHRPFLVPQYIGNYTDLVLAAASHYGSSQLNVFLAVGPMSSAYGDAVQTVISQVTKQGVKAHLLDQTHFLNGTFGPACCGHPSVEVDTAMADYTARVIASVLGW